MNIREFKAYARERLASSLEQPELRFLVSALLAHFAGIPNYWYHTREEHILPPTAEKALLKAVDQATQGRPLQYILGFVHFGNCRIGVDERVLIPRPETEEMWDRARHIPGVVLDACTGSGCLAIALKKGRPVTNVYAFDLSRDALEVASQNAALNQAEVHFFLADLNDIPGVEEAVAGAGLEKQAVGLLISNPPYVTESQKKGMSRRVLSFEPHSALFVPDKDPLIHYRQLAALGSRFLCSGGTLMAEINEYFGRETGRLLQQAGYSEIRVHRDLNEKNRIIEARWVP
ncbi:MAG: peptide chain release factor N(5)-glutamine methyltransferase [Bacteroidales bacterium]|jgi:release factor glutamine methyltransferase|nr:peptide chain release factor N(5)-glutamine methyltransferase [Bacteroidales bacterium]HPJ82970.1 peptide chain release factor N(5)-glutamine methyltransferase [Bacteroidales bacterium]